MKPKNSDLDGFVKSSNSRRTNFVIMWRTNGTLNDYEMQHNEEVGLFTRSSKPVFLTVAKVIRQRHAFKFYYMPTFFRDTE